MSLHTNDIVILGSGLGGLVCAAILSKEGYKVLVLEKNKQIGGALQSFGLDGKLFESAVHYIGSMQEGQTLHMLYDYLDIANKLSLERLNMDGFDKIILAEDSYQLAQGHDNFIERLSTKFPSQSNGIKKLCEEMVDVCEHFPLYNMRMGSYEEKRKVSYQSLQEIMTKHISDEKLMQVLNGNNLLFAGDFSTSPFFQYALIENSYIESSYKFTEGSAQLAKLLQQVITNNGGVVLRNKDIHKIHELNGTIHYAETKEGEKFFGKHFISNLHPQQTYALLNSTLIRPITKRRIQSTENTLSCFMVNISLKEKCMPYESSNTYYHKSANVWKDLKSERDEVPNSYGIYWYGDRENPSYADRVSILCYMHMNEVNAGADTFRTTSQASSRGKDYEEWKNMKINMIVENLKAIYPNLTTSIQKVDACTPLTYRDYLNTPYGSLYGLKKNVTELSNTTFATRTKIPNLFFTGQNINLHGILGVSITALLTASEFVNLEHLIQKINKPKS